MNNRRFRWGIREKLTLLFFMVTLLAVTINFMLVVPRLETRLQGDRIGAMERDASRLGGMAQQIFTQFDQNLVVIPSGGAWDQFFRDRAATSTGRVAVLKHVAQPSPLGPLDRFIVVWDPTGETPVDGSTLIEDQVAAEAIRTGRSTTGLSDFGTGLHGESAIPLKSPDGTTPGAVVFTTPLDGVTATVQQVARRQVLSGMIALAISLLAGVLASSYMARRLRRLETAARAVSGGNFTEPIVVDSEDEIGEVARAFNTMQDRLGRADRARRAFIANASHELRTPLFSLGGYVELMREEELDEDTQREFLDQMHVQILRMSKLATDLLDLSKIDAGSLQVNPQQVDLVQLARSVKREFEPQLAQHASAISIAEGGPVETICDPDRVAQIARILVDNVLSHTPRGTQITITLEHDQDGSCLSVGDDGPGIDADVIGRIFDRFYTGDKTGGTGLGLSIARELAAAMDGTLDVKSSSEGTTFTLRLPAGVRVRS